MKPALVLVGADKGGVGKTTVSRVLLDYFADHEVEARAFDTESPRGTLSRFHPDITEVVDITETSDQMRVVDTLSDANVTVLDIRAGHLRTTLEALQNFGFLDAVEAGEFNFLLFHILGSSIASLDEISETAPFAANAHYFLVKNYVSDTTFFEWDPRTHRTYFSQIGNATEITIPKLDDLAFEQVDLDGVSFRRFIDDKKKSFVLRGYVRTWLNAVYEDLDRAKVLRTLTGRATIRR